MMDDDHSKGHVYTREETVNKLAIALTKQTIEAVREREIFNVVTDLIWKQEIEAVLRQALRWSAESSPELDNLPDCMMPDGAEPCEGFRAEVYRREVLEAEYALCRRRLLALTEEICQAERNGMERAARYHDEQASKMDMINDQENYLSGWHQDAAAAIRSLSPTAQQDDPKGW